MLTALDDVEDRVRGLDSGADDYLAKPFSFDELLARMRALMRRGAPPRPDRAHGRRTCGSIRRATGSGVDDSELSLTPREFSLLELFMRRPGEVLSRFELLEHVWDDSYENRSNVIEVYVGYLRDKLDRETHRDRARRRLPAAGHESSPGLPFRVRLTLSFAGVDDRAVRRPRPALGTTQFSASLDQGIDRSLRTHAADLATLVQPTSTSFPSCRRRGGAFAQIIDPATGVRARRHSGHAAALLSRSELGRASGRSL